MAFQELASVTKRIARFPGWQRSGPEKSVLWFDAELEIEGVVEQGFILHGECRIDLPDQNVGLEIVYTIPGSRRRIPLARVDWLSIRGGHRNKRRKGWPMKGKRMPPTHFHPFDLNFNASTGKMRPGDLPVAAEISGELQTFESARAMAGFLLRISNIDLVSRPPWEYRLL
jgi:hypothetical protein